MLAPKATMTTTATMAGRPKIFVNFVAPVFVCFVAESNSFHARRSARR
jgi:hypothetical protein